MLQFFADQIDQLDLCLDQLAIRDRNFDRFALMLVDNVVELTLHQHAEDAAVVDKEWRSLGEPRHDAKILADALGRDFRAKVRFARHSGLASDEVATSVQHLHTFRNRVYHAGLRHETILHSLALFYFENACLILSKYEPNVWSSGSRDQISHRALKYLGKTNFMRSEESVKAAWIRLLEVGTSLGDTLLPDLCSDLAKIVDDVDEQIRFLSEDAPQATTRKQAVVESQILRVAFTESGKAFASANQCPAKTVADYISWMVAHFECSAKDDPIPRWRKRLENLRSETNRHSGFNKYCDFLTETEGLRDAIDASAVELDRYIQLQIDIARGK
jgi:hypothetical protein